MWSVDEHVIRNEKDVEGTTVRQALADATQLCARASADTPDEIQLFSLVLERLEAARDELQSAFAGAPPADRQRALDALTKELVKFSGQLQFYCETSVAGRVLYHKKAVRAMKEIHEGARNVYHYCDGGLDQFFSMIRADKTHPTEWKEPFAQSVTAFEAAVAAVVERAETLDAYKTDALVALEAATLLSNAQRSGDALEWQANAPAQRLRERLKYVDNSDDVKLPEWFVSESEVNYRSRQFAKGSFGAVHRGTWGSGTKVVVKVLLTDGSSDRLSATLRKKFIDEAELWSKMSHPYVLKLYGACHVTAPPFFVCEDATKGDLKALLATDKSRLWRLLFQSALAIEYLHSKKVVHGDLKLNNILVGADGYARVADFGLSRFKKPSRDNTLSRQDSVIDGVGALRWRAPEALDSKAQYASDVYSFGLCLIEALSGETPYEYLDDKDVIHMIQNHILPERPADMSDEIWALVQKMTEREPSARATIKQVTDALKKLANDELTKETEKVSLCQVCSSRLDDGSLYCRRCQRATVAKPVSKEVGPILSKEDLPRVIELVTLSDSGHEHKAPNALREYMFGQPDHQRYVFEAGAIPVLVKVLAEELENADAQLEALTALGCTMVANKKIQRVAKFENVIEMLKENLTSPLDRMQIKSVLVLGYSAHGSPESREEIAGNAEVMDRIRAMAAAGPEDDDLPMAATKALMFLDPQAFSEPAKGA